jgi:hypothetical protein
MPICTCGADPWDPRKSVTVTENATERSPRRPCDRSFWPAICPGERWPWAIFPISMDSPLAVHYFRPRLLETK